jgi:hypothetical protein
MELEAANTSDSFALHRLCLLQSFLIDWVGMGACALTFLLPAVAKNTQTTIRLLSTMIVATVRC